MENLKKVGIIAIIISLVGILLLAFASDEKIPVSQLPKKVSDAVAQKLPGGKIVAAEKETENNQAQYEVEVEKDGRHYEIDLNENGDILEFEEEGKAEEIDKGETEQEHAESGQDESDADFVCDFESYSPGALPSNWSAAMTGKGKPGKWEILTDERDHQPTRVLAQTFMENYGYHFDVAVAKETNYKNLELSVKLKAIKGKEDQGGGPVWRYQDENNYYIARANPLESNFRVYKVIDGNRKQLKSYSLPVTSGEWHTIKIEHIGPQIKCYFDGQLYLEVEDDQFLQPGKVGVWTKADSYCYFDDLVVEEE